ncbi:hypothetical protein K438DRAFT_1758989 [Mycena galopus ATCC 62051]|nr:hypothetical protein K438DRAFT_1758989 [Mycena galopus ATCC 62051]
MVNAYKAGEQSFSNWPSFMCMQTGDPVWYLSGGNWLPGWYYDLIGPYALPNNLSQPIWRDVVTRVKGSTDPDDHVTLDTHDQVKDCCAHPRLSGYHPNQNNGASRHSNLERLKSNPLIQDPNSLLLARSSPKAVKRIREFPRLPQLTVAFGGVPEA